MDRIRGMADEIVDTSTLTVHELREWFMSFAREQAQRNPLIVTMLSFGFKHGVPARRRPRVRRAVPAEPALRAGAEGPDRARPGGREVHGAARGHRPVRREAARSLLAFLVPQYVAEGKSYLTIAIGCTGGRHRSVMLAESARPSRSRRSGRPRPVRHRDMRSAGGNRPTMIGVVVVTHGQLADRAA